MGFHPPRKTATIDFAQDHDYHGMTAVLSLDVSSDLLFDLMEMNEAGDMAAKDQREMYRRFGDAALVEWNVLDDDDQPVPATGAGMLTQTPEFMGILMEQWTGAMSPSGPLGNDSTSGEQSPAPEGMTAVS